MPQYVAYTNGLRHKDHLNNADSDEGWFSTGDEVTPEAFSDEDWQYHVTHGNIVRKGGPHDPEVLNAALEPEEISDNPLEQENRMLREQLAIYQGRGGTPAPGLIDEDAVDEDDDIEEVEQSQTVPPEGLREENQRPVPQPQPTPRPAS
jgi:hypothetical protein